MALVANEWHYWPDSQPAASQHPTNSQPASRVFLYFGSHRQVVIDDITFDNKPKNLCADGCEVAVDTGTSMLAGPSDLVDKLSSMLGAKEEA